MYRLAGKTSQLLLFFAFTSLLFYLSESSVNLLKTPSKFSHRSSPLFAFDVSETECSSSTNCSFTCKLDNGIASKCESKRISYSNLRDGNHTFEVCTINNGLGCVTYNWTIDTVPPTASITALSPFTNALNFSVNVSFSEPCIANGGFSCLSANACNVLVYGSGRVIPSSLSVLEKNLKYSLAVSLSPEVSYGRVVLAMDKDFCSDIAGNRFARTPNSTFFLHYDRRSVFVNVRVHIPERLVELSGKTRTVLATNNERQLRAYLYFSEPILNSSAEILSSVRTSQGKLVPIQAQTIGNRRFGFLIENLSSVSVVTLRVETGLIISRPGTPVSPVLPTTFLLDSKRPSVKLSTTSSWRTRDHNISIAIAFVKPVFDFNSSHVSISGGHLKSFHQISRSTYILGMQASDNTISVHVPENVTADVSGNKNLASNVLQVRHYSVPLLSSIASGLVTISFLATCLVSGFLSFSTSSLQIVWTFKGPSSLRTNPARNLFRIACHIQVFAFSRWLAVMLPVEYYEFVIGLQWSIPYFHLPWEAGHANSVMVGTSPDTAAISERVQPTQVFGLPLDPMEYRFYFENPNTKPKAEVLWDPHNRNGWTNFERSMFWLALIAGSLVLLHIILLSLLKLRKKSSESSSAGFGALTLPRLEIFLIILALPCLSQVSSALLKGKDTSGMIVGISMLSLVAILLMSLFVFLSYGVTFARLLQYKEVQREGSTWRWYGELVRVTLGPGKRGQWTWKKRSPRSLLALGPMFEDLRGPPKYMLSQIIAGGDQNNSTAGKSAGDRIIASDDETEDAEAPAIQKLFGILRIYYTFLDCSKRVLLGVMAGTHTQNWLSSSRSPATALLCLTSFQLFFLLLKKLFIKKRVQLTEILTVSAEAALFAACLGLKSHPSSSLSNLVGALMVSLFFVWYVPQMANEWWALYGQIKLLDPEERSSARGFLIALVGSALVFLPRKWVDELERKFSKPRVGQSRSRSRSQSTEKSSSQGSGPAEKPWLRQLRDMAKASFSREGSGGANEASTSRSGGWSGLWGSKKSGSSPGVGNADNNKSNKGLLYKDLEDIFAAK